jgi:hypothetical protein
LKCIRFKHTDATTVEEVAVPRRQIRYGQPSVEKALGALPVVAELCRRLDIAGIVDRAAPVRDIAYVTHGQVIEALVANRLTSPTPLVHVEDWARTWAVEEVFSIAPAVMNDDRIGRALDAVAPELGGIVGSIGARAIAEFGIDVARIHWDMTSISLYGAFASPDPDYIEPRFGHPKDRRPDLLTELREESSQFRALDFAWWLMVPARGRRGNQCSGFTVGAIGGITQDDWRSVGALSAA